MNMRWFSSSCHPLPLQSIVATHSVSLLTTTQARCRRRAELFRIRRESYEFEIGLVEPLTFVLLLRYSLVIDHL